MLTQSNAGSLAGPSDPDPAGLVLVDYSGVGDFAWLRRELDACIGDADRLDDELPRDDSARFDITDQGRAALAADARERAIEALFGPWPTAAEAFALGGAA